MRPEAAGLTDPGRARVSAVVANLVDNEQVELMDYSRRLIGLLNERSNEFESSIVSLRAIAEKTRDKRFLASLDKAEKHYEKLMKSETEARRVADRERAAAAAATERAETAEAATVHEQRRSHFLESVVNLDTATILNLHHQVTIYAVDLAQQIENILADSAGQKLIPRETVLNALEQLAFLNHKILAITRFAAKANFKLDSERIYTDLAAFIADYIEQIARVTSSARMQIEAKNDHPGMRLRFNPIDVAIIVDNLISNARRAKASRITFQLSQLEKAGLSIRVTDNGAGLVGSADPERIFAMGYTTTKGSGLGLYHVRQILGEIGGSIELAGNATDRGISFLIKISAGMKTK